MFTQQSAINREEDLNKFFLHFDKEKPFYNDLSPQYQKQLRVNKCNILQYQENYMAGTPVDNITAFQCYTGGKIISIQSSSNFLHITCSYGRSTECLRERNIQPPASSCLKALERGNLPEKVQPPHIRKPLRRGYRLPEQSSIGVSEVSYIQQGIEIHDFMQSLSGSSSVDFSTYVTSIKSACRESHGRSDSTVRSSVQSPINLDSSKGRIITIASDNENDLVFATPEMALPVARQEEPSPSPPAPRQEVLSPADLIRSPAGAAGAAAAAGGSDTPRSSGVTSGKRSIRPRLSIIYNNTPAISEDPVRSQGFPGSDLPAILPSGHVTPTSPSVVQSRSSRRNK